MRSGIVLLLAASLGLAGCSALPEAGPSTGAVETGSGYRLVAVTGAMVPVTDPAIPDYAAAFAVLPPGAKQGTIAPGDTLQITLWEANPTGATLLSPPGLQTTLRVDASGMALLPFAGTLRVAGETPLVLQRRIMGILQGQGHAIQAMVLDTQPGADKVTLEGAAARPGVFPLIPGMSLLGLIAAGGGARESDDETMVCLRRAGLSAAAPLAAIDSDPRLDVALAPGDEVVLLPRRLEYYAFGAVNHPGIFAYDAPAITLLQALAETAGLQDNRAAPRGVFLYRPGQAQTVYQLDLSQPQGFFEASRFSVQPGDVLYVSNAPVANVAKVLQTITGLGTIAGVPRNFGAPY